MGSGESDARTVDYKTVPVKFYTEPEAPVANNSATVVTNNTLTGFSTGGSTTGFDTQWSYPYYYSFTSTVYKYQIFCPSKRCKAANWLLLDVVTPCAKCGLKLKAVSEEADFEIEVTK